MSTSPEAKQAAGWTYRAVAIVGSPRAVSFTVFDERGEPITRVYTRSDAETICGTHDAATAKLREELGSLIQRLLDTSDSPAHEKHGARLDAMHWLKGQQPAHQQPSANYYCNKCGYFGATSEHGGCNYFAAQTFASATGEKQ